MELLKPTTRSIFNSPCQVLVCPTNILGVMGNGLARAYRDRYQGLYEVFQRRCRMNYISNRGLNISNLVSVGNGKHVLMFPTKSHFLDDSKIEYIEAALYSLPTLLREMGLTSIAFPKVGCGKGNLNWELDVRPLLIRELGLTEFSVEIYE